MQHLDVAGGTGDVAHRIRGMLERACTESSHAHSDAPQVFSHAFEQNDIFFYANLVAEQWLTYRFCCLLLGHGTAKVNSILTVQNLGHLTDDH